MDEIGFWQTLLAGASGGALTIVATWLTAHYDLKGQREARKVENATARRTRKESFELEVLEGLRKEHLPALGQATRDHFHALQAGAEDEPLAGTGLPFRKASTEVLAGAAATFNQDVKDALECFCEKADQLILRSVGDSEEAALAFFAAEKEARESVGARIVVMLDEDSA